jgi:surfeit locus 1 family protein
LTLLGVALFVRLGMWQLHRADEKQALLDQYAAGQRSTVELTVASLGSLQRYQQVRAEGHYDPGRQVLLDNMPSQHGRPGYRVVTPFQLASGDWLLVDRGWVPMGRSRMELPEVPVGSETRSIVGRLDELPRAGVHFDAPDDPATNWPRVMNFPQQPTLEQALGHPLLKGLLLLDPKQADGYERVWEAHFSFGPERHIGYAVQWFALAAAAVVIYLILGFRRSRDAGPSAATRPDSSQDP